MKLNICLMGLLCLFFKVSAQQSAPFSGLKLGDSVPNLTITNVINYPTVNFKLSDFKGKLVILDFWATWCAPCVKMIPHLDSLQRQFRVQVQFVSVSNQNTAVVEPFLNRLKKEHSFDLVEVEGDNNLTSLFRPVSLPHFAWIDTSGKFIAFTEATSINAETIRSVLKGNLPEVDSVREVAVNYDEQYPLFREISPDADSSILYHAVLTGYKAGLGCGFYSDVTKAADGTPTRRITARNLTVAQLYQIAMSDGYKTFGWQNTTLKVTDTTALNTRLSGEKFESWLKDNRGFCYEIVVPVQSAGIATKIMRLDLEKFFPQYLATIDSEQQESFVLVQINGGINAPTNNGQPEATFDFTRAHLSNCSLYVLTKRIALYLQHYRLPIVNETNYQAHVDLDLSTDLSDIEGVNRELARYNLRFIKKKVPQQVLVITDK